MRTNSSDISTLEKVAAAAAAATNSLQSCLTLRDPWTAAYQASPSMGVSRQEYWSGLPLPSPSKKLHMALRFDTDCIKMKEMVVFVV